MFILVSDVIGMMRDAIATKTVAQKIFWQITSMHEHIANPVSLQSKALSLSVALRYIIGDQHQPPRMPAIGYIAAAPASEHLLAAAGIDRGGVWSVSETWQRCIACLHFFEMLYDCTWVCRESAS